MTADRTRPETGSQEWQNGSKADDGHDANDSVMCKTPVAFPPRRCRVFYLEFSPDQGVTHEHETLYDILWDIIRQQCRLIVVRRHSL